jgi:hypothetical protein
VPTLVLVASGPALVVVDVMVGLLLVEIVDVPLVVEPEVVVLVVVVLVEVEELSDVEELVVVEELVLPVVVPVVVDDVEQYWY